MTLVVWGLVSRLPPEASGETHDQPLPALQQVVDLIGADVGRKPLANRLVPNRLKLLEQDRIDAPPGIGNIIGQPSGTVRDVPRLF